MAHDTQTLEQVSKATAAREFSACLGLDAEGVETPQSAAARGLCYQITSKRGRVVVSVDVSGGVYWCIAAAGQGERMTGTALIAMEQHARGQGCKSIGFQTIRTGLVRLAKRQGYHSRPHGRGFILEKTL